MKSLIDFPTAPMTAFQVSTFIDTCLAEKVNSHTDELPAIARIILARLGPNIPVSMPLIAYVAMLSEGNPGFAVSLAWTLRAIYVKFGRPVTTHEFALAFPMGVPTMDSFSKFWDYQKDAEWGNSVDNPELWAL